MFVGDHMTASTSLAGVAAVIQTDRWPQTKYPSHHDTLKSTLMACRPGVNIVSDWFLNGLNFDPTSPDGSPYYDINIHTDTIITHDGTNYLPLKGRVPCLTEERSSPFVNTVNK